MGLRIVPKAIPFKRDPNVLHRHLWFVPISISFCMPLIPNSGFDILSCNGVCSLLERSVVTRKSRLVLCADSSPSIY